MNLERILRRYSEKECRRIDIEIVKEHWGKGLGSEAIRLPTDFDCDINEDNAGSLRAFQNAGFMPP